jgi:hypothetical protein
VSGTGVPREPIADVTDWKLDARQISSSLARSIERASI